MKIASWNVNSIKVRLDHVKDWLTTHKPDILMIQELKGVAFPANDFEEIGYRSAFVSQKAYNGVATLSRHKIDVIKDKLDGDKKDDQARYLEADINGLRLINIYLPNGNPVLADSSSLRKQGSSRQSAQDPGLRRDDSFSDKFDYKLSWMDRLKDRLVALREDKIAFAVGGDFNVIPEPRDCYDPKAWDGDALFRPESHAKFRSLLNLGLTDAFRVYNQQAEQYTYWDYQRGAWPANKGIRIDHFLLSPPVTDRLTGCTIDQDPRGLEKASDHTPIMIELQD